MDIYFCNDGKIKWYILWYEIFILESAVPKYKLVSKTYIFLNRLRRAFSRYFWISMRMHFKVRVSRIKIWSRVDWYFKWRVETRNILKHIRFDCNWQYFTILYSNFECYQGYWKYKKSFDKWLCVSPQELLPLPYRFPFIIFYDFDHDVHLKCQRHRYLVVWQHFVVAKNRFWPRMP